MKFEKYNGEQPMLLLARRSYHLVALAMGNAFVKFGKCNSEIYTREGVLARKSDLLIELVRSFWRITCKTHQCNISLMDVSPDGLDWIISDGKPGVSIRPESTDFV